MGHIPNVPTYMKHTQGVDIKKNGILSGLPFLSRYFGGVIICRIADFMLARKMMSTTNLRRLFNSIAMVPPAAALLMVAFASGGYECDTTYIIAILCIGMTFNGAFSAGHFSSHLDLAPNFAGTLMGISNTFAGGCGTIVPMVIGAIRELDYLDPFTQWKIVFTLAAGIYLLGNFCYVLMISGEVQAWNFGPKGRNGWSKEEHYDKEMENVEERRS